MYRDSCIARWLDLRRKPKAVMDVLDAMIRSGCVSCAFVDCILRLVRSTLSPRVIFSPSLLVVLVCN